MTESHTAYLLMSHLLRALSHKIRTPLSVISNDLHYVASAHPEVDVSRPQEKIKNIADMLAESVRHLLHTPVAEDCQLDSVLQDAGLKHDGNDANVTVRCDKLMVVEALKSLKSLLDYGIIGCARLGSVVTLELQAGLSGVNNIQEFSLFTQLFNENLQYQSTIPPIIDALLKASNVEVHGRVHGEVVKVQLQFSS